MIIINFLQLLIFQIMIVTEHDTMYIQYFITPLIDEE